MTTLLPEPDFVDRDPATTLKRCIDFMESPVTGVGRPLSPSGYERAMVAMVAYEATLARIAIQEAAKQNLPAFARYPMIDYLAAINGGERLAARPAVTTLQWTLPAALGIDSPIPAGTQLRSKDGRVTFSTDADVVIEIGGTTVSVPATCTTPGELGNGYGPGQISELVAPLPFTVSGANVSTTADGAGSEGTESLRTRLPSLVLGASVAGPSDSYARLARGAHPSVLEVAIVDLDDGQIQIVVLGRGGVAPSAPVLSAVEAACSARTARPMSDRVTAVAATPRDYTIAGSVTLFVGSDPTSWMAAANARAQAFAAERAAGLGRGIEPAQVVAAIVGAPQTDASGRRVGVYGVTLSAPAASSTLPQEWSRCTSIALTLGGYAS